jgi:hypothetical protein
MLRCAVLAVMAVAAASLRVAATEPAADAGNPPDVRPDSRLLRLGWKLC